MTIANAMIAADKKVNPMEVIASMAWLSKMGFSETDMKMGAMNGPEAMSIISNLTPKEKEVVTAMLMTIIVADDEVSDNERKLLALITALCNLPVMSAEDVEKTLKSLQ